MNDEQPADDRNRHASPVSPVGAAGVFDQSLPWMILLVAGCAWGSTFSLAKIATQDGTHPFAINMWTAVIGASLLAIVNAVRRRRIPLGKPYLIFYLVAGLLGTAIPNTLFYYAAPHLSAGVMSISIAAVPIVTLTVAVGVRIDRLSVGRTSGVLLGIAAVLMLVLPGTSLPSPGAAAWVLVAFGAAICYALENVYIALRVPDGCDALVVLCGMLSVATLLLAPAAYLTGTFAPLALVSPSAADLAIIAIGVINVLAYALFVHLVTLAGPVFASQMAYTVTLSGVIWGLVFFGEQHTAWVWGALVVMLVGVGLVKPTKRGSG